ncbi:MAG: Ig-like domain-containing protein [Clostridia bacterium]|nr:Ig-like domain-containing protein [Clostridia bacterium]
MKKSKIIILIASIILVALTVVAVAAATISESTLGIIDAIINGEDYDVEKDLNGDQKIDILDVILGVKKDNFKGPKLQTLTLDGGYAVEEEVEFDNFTYTVQLPAGRPRIPHITATADNEDAVVAYQNATIADNETSGYAKVIISDESGENIYTVKFERAEVVDTVVLQYDDRWTFTPDYELKDGEAFTFESTDSSVASVDANGVITAENVSENAVVISAKVGEETVDTFTVSKIDKAVVNLFLVTGQSNAQGCYDFVDTDGDGTKEDSEKFAQATEQLKDVIQPDKAGQVYIYDARPYWNSYNSTDDYVLEGGLSAFYDLYDVKRTGFASALGKTYYDLSGEKVAFLHAAYNGSCIERWLDPAKHPELADADFNHYVNAQNTYKELIKKLDSSKYEINHRANFWLQGETCMSNLWDYDANNWKTPTAYEKLFSAEDYTDMFMKFHEQMKADFQIETNNILLVRAHGSIVPNKDTNIKAALNNVRSSQYGMANTNSEITIVSRLSDWVVPYNAKYIGTPYEAYNGLMGVGNVHYNQTGHNENGIIAATNYFKKLDVDTTSIATSVEIIDTDGIKRFDENEAIGEFEVGKTKRIAAFPLPEYSLENVTYSSSNKEIANVNEFGLITIVGVGEATITATAESGVSASVVVKGIERTTAPTKFTLDEFATKTIVSYLPEFRFADITYTSDNEEVATVNDKGLITVVGGGEANIKATSKTGAYEEFIITGIAQQIVADSLHYRWDFNGNLKSSADENDLRLSDLATQNGATEDSYKFMEDGTIFIDKNIADLSKPDFTMAYPVTVSSETDWAIEWRAQFTGVGILLGVENAKTTINGSNKYINHIYCVYTQKTAIKDYDYVLYPLRFSDSNGDSYFPSYTATYAGMNTSMNTWKLDYKKYTGKMTLSVLKDGNWIAISAVEPGEFTATYNNIFGRYNANGLVNFDGYMDYLDIKVSPAEVLYDTHYRWDFEAGKEYDSTYDENTLTPTGTNYSITDDGLVTSGKVNEFKLNNAIVLDDKHDWMIETEFCTTENNVMLIGLENCHLSSGYESHIYFGGKGYNGIRIEPDANAGSGITIPFTVPETVRTEMKTMNKWRIGYEVVTDTLTVYMYNTTTGAWDKVGEKTSAPTFTVTSDCLFGDFDGANSYNMNGTVKYFDVLVEAQKTVNEREYVYDWDFNNWGSRGLQNTLTPGETSGTLENGEYTVGYQKDELILQKPITLDSTMDWMIEWSANVKSANYSLFGVENGLGRNNNIYFSATGYKGVKIRLSNSTSDSANPLLEFTDTTIANTKDSTLTWRLSHVKDTKTLTVEYYDTANGKWVNNGTLIGKDFSMTFTRMFGDYGKSSGDPYNFYNFYGTADYVTVRYTVSD